VEISCRVYRPRRPRDSPLFQLVERHLEELLRVWPTRFAWQPLPEWNATLLMSLSRERLLARLVLAHAISPELVKKLLAWKHPGFSAHVGERIAPTDKLRLEDTAAYLVRNPLLCGRPHSSGYADFAIMLTLGGTRSVLPKQGMRIAAVGPSAWSA
jgi:hypothetical protein